MTKVVLQYQVNIKDVFEPDEGYSYENAKEALEGALKEIFGEDSEVQVSVKEIRRETIEFK